MFDVIYVNNSCARSSGEEIRVTADARLYVWNGQKGYSELCVGEQHDESLFWQMMENAPGYPLLVEYQDDRHGTVYMRKADGTEELAGTWDGISDSYELTLEAFLAWEAFVYSDDGMKVWKEYCADTDKAFPDEGKHGLRVYMCMNNTELVRG